MELKLLTNDSETSGNGLGVTATDITYTVLDADPLSLNSSLL
jgi:hypothetical protein